ncbi:MAG TPA: hypothetical protein VJ123_02445 [Anaerolineales bacterium]|nr:hypothetical protein [Anaerolineales bacterium]
MKSLHADRRSKRRSELTLAGIAVLVITALYLLVVLRSGMPAASGLFGHSLGVFGFLLMLATETLYSIRKRAPGRGWGRMSEWLRFHIFTGIVGPYLVFLHSAWSFKGLAGATLLLTGILVLSGFVGRYIYTAVPRTAEGTVIEAQVLRQQLAIAETGLQRHLRLRGTAGGLVPAMALVEGQGRRMTRWWGELSMAAQVWLVKRRLDPVARERMAEIALLARRHRELRRQIRSIATARRLLAIWHSIHVPLGLALFTIAFIHAAAAMYYATLLK